MVEIPFLAPNARAFWSHIIPMIGGGVGASAKGLSPVPCRVACPTPTWGPKEADGGNYFCQRGGCRKHVLLPRCLVLLSNLIILINGSGQHFCIAFR